ncbi:MAG: hypothetical protein ACFCU5_14185 [Pleurocapsa sp.]
METIKLGKYLTLVDFCTCTQTYQKYAQKIDPMPQNPVSIEALKELNKLILDPIIDRFGQKNFKLTYGFCSLDLKKYLAKKDPVTGLKNGRVEPSIDQHMAHELNRNGNYFCQRLGAACDFLILNLFSDELVEWILNHKLPFDSLYFYGRERPIHISYGKQHKRDIWTFNRTGQPTKKGIDRWLGMAKAIDI